MRVLVACEFSGIVREAFAALGHDAWSCDFLPSEQDGQHFLGDIRVILEQEPDWDLMIAHPPCTHLAVSGARWFKEKQQEQAEALEFVKFLLAADIKKICLENPISVISSKIRKPDQIIQPWQFGHPQQKTTCLWLKGLPKLVATDIVVPEFITMKNGKRMSKFHYDTFTKIKINRGHERSRTFPGIAEAMAAQWGCLIP